MSNDTDLSAVRAPVRANLLSKVPAVTALFWVTKILTTGMGETASDYLTHRIDPFIAAIFGALLLVVALAWQFSTRRYIAWAYWFACVAVSIFGTMAADALHVKLGVPYAVSTTFYAIVLAAVFALWYRTERSLSIHNIRTRRQETFYWATVLTTFALGTAVGDLTAVTFHLGFFASGALFAIVFTIPGICYRWFGMNSVLAFWWAYIATRPLGASFADWIGVSKARGGLGFGTLEITAILSVAILVLVAYAAVTRCDIQAETQPV